LAAGPFWATIDFMEDTANVENCLRAYDTDCQPSNLESLGNAGGFSGAQFWRLETPRGHLCLRCWPPEHPDRERLQFIHGVLKHVVAECDVPLPLATSQGDTFVEQAGHFWQLEPWLPGAADFQEKPNDARLTAAMSALANFHKAAETFPHSGAAEGPSPGFAARLAKTRSWTDEKITRLLQAIQSARRPEHEPIIPLVREIVTLYRSSAAEVERTLAAVEARQLPLQPCLRDIHDGHVLFEGDEVSGLIDFGSMRIDHVTCDVARLLGSLVADDVGRRQAALIAYEEVRPITMSDRVLIRIWDRSTSLLSGMNWLEWIFLDGRTFPDYTTIAARLEKIRDRLRVLAGS